MENVNEQQTGAPAKHPKASVSWSDPIAKQSASIAGTSVDSVNFIDLQKRRLSEARVIQQINEAKHQSENKMGFARKACIILITSTCFTLLLTLLLAIPISKILMGSFFLKSCPVEPFIPLYLLVGGSIAVARDLMNIFVRYLFSGEKYEKYETPVLLFVTIYEMGELIWFVYGSIYVYATYEQYQYRDPTQSNYCHMVLYAYAFLMTTLSYFLIVVVVTFSCITLCLAEYLDDWREEPHTTVVVIETIP